MKLLTIKEISEKWGLSERTIRKLCVEEWIPEQSSLEAFG